MQYCEYCEYCEYCKTYAILVECFRDSQRQCPVQYLHWSIKHLLILLLLCTVHWRCLLQHCVQYRISYHVLCTTVLGYSCLVAVCIDILYWYCIEILYQRYCIKDIVLKILNMVHVYSKVWIFMFSRRLYSRYWSQRISSQLLLSQI